MLSFVRRITCSHGILAGMINMRGAHSHLELFYPMIESLK
jgi:hypothetical protein